MIDLLHSVAVYVAVLLGILFEQVSKGAEPRELLDYTRLASAIGLAFGVMIAKERKGDIRGKRAHFGWRLVEAFGYGYTVTGIIGR
jgi:hypothetical protein